MVRLTNNWIIVSQDDVAYFSLKINLKKKMPPKKIRKRNNTVTNVPQPDEPLYYIDEQSGDMYIPVGLFEFISEQLKLSKIVDCRVFYDIDADDLSEIERYRSILGGIELRNEQLLAIRKALINGRGILELATGSGKTEIMCGIVKYLMLKYGKCPTVLLLEPTINLQHSTINRFKKYDIPALSYTDNREIKLNTVNVAHPQSLGNDLDTNPDLLNSVDVLLCDECHHFSADSFRRPTYNMSNLKMSIGVSASAISQEHIDYTNILDFDMNEILAISATGRLLMNVITADMVNDGNLAKPVLMIMKYECRERLENGNPSDWADISKTRLESENRSKYITACADVFSRYGRKTLILVNTIRWAENLLKLLYDSGVSAGASFGSGKMIRYNGIIFEKNKDVMRDFESGDISVLVATSHLYEGADIPNLDTIILGYGGKGERTQIQGIGRALRITKNGKYAYVVDFTDNGDLVLNRHFNSRLSRYKNIIGITDDRIFYNNSSGDLEKNFKELEEMC